MTIASEELRIRASEVLQRVKGGETVSITEGGRTIAVLKPAPVDDRKPSMQEWLKRAEEFRKAFVAAHGGRGLTMEEIKSGIEEGRR